MEARAPYPSAGSRVMRKGVKMFSLVVKSAESQIEGKFIKKNGPYSDYILVSVTLFYFLIDG